MKRKLVAAATIAAGIAGIGVATAPSANAYAYWSGEYFYADTSYARNVDGAYVRVTGRRDIAKQIYYLKIYLYDTKTDSNRAAVRVRGWDKQSGKYLYYYSSPIIGANGEEAAAQGTIAISTQQIDTIIVQDGIYGKTYGTNSVAVFRRYPAEADAMLGMISRSPRDEPHRGLRSHGPVRRHRARM